MQSKTTDKKRIIILGAAGRDFHNFNVVYRDDPSIEVVAFTAAQIPGISERRYPPALAGPDYPDGIPIANETDLERLCHAREVDQVVFAYSDVTHAHVMHLASVTLAAGADFILLGPERTMLRAAVPVISVCAVRTGCGKSQTARWLSRLLKGHGLNVAIIRHPMPYGDLEEQVVQRFATMDDLDTANCTIEEREEYEPHLAIGNVVYAGVDYGEILKCAEKEADILFWDGGNNDFSFIHPDLQISLIDPLRPGHGLSHHPGEAVLRMADIVLVSKTNSASEADILSVIDGAKTANPRAKIVRGASPVTLDDPGLIRGKRVIVVEDGPTITHGGMPYGAGYVAASQAGAAEIIDPRPFATREISSVYAAYPHIGAVLPAVGYYKAQLQALAATLSAAPIDAVVSATPTNLAKLIKIDKPIARAFYEYADVSKPGLGELVEEFAAKQNLI
ncbi:MAG: GTPase [Rhodobacteraceae bacterium]|nr:GTPase [Paracoccaceae bacterium]